MYKMSMLVLWDMTSYGLTDKDGGTMCLTTSPHGVTAIKPTSTHYQINTLTIPTTKN